MSQFDTEFRRVHATMLEAHELGQKKKPDPSFEQCFEIHQRYLTELCAYLLMSNKIPEASIALVAQSALSLLAAAAVRRLETESAVAPDVDRLCKLAGGEPRV